MIVCAIIKLETRNAKRVSDIREVNMEIKFRKNFKMGVATASSQIEGGNSNSNWNNWYDKGMIKDSSNPARANDHYNRFKSDIDLMAEMNIEIYRMSIEWSRLEPMQGVFSDMEFQHYIDEIKYLQSKNIEVLLTLHHFNNPMWFEELGGFVNKESPYIFNNFVKTAVSKLGHLVNEFITINEPNVYSTSAYYFGEFPPGEKSISKCRKVMTNLAKAHILTYSTVHDIRKKMGYADTKVGYASHVRIFQARRKSNIVDKIGAKLMEQMFQSGLDETCMLGKAKFPIIKSKFFKAGKFYDFIGINYYSRSQVKVFDEMAKDDAPHNDMGWEIYPEGIKIVCEKYYAKFKAPIYITENGTADGRDDFRAKFIYDHLSMLSKANADIRKYYHWTFIDNFEWMDGEKERFGLVSLDYETQTREVRQSGKFYSEIIKRKKITQEMHDKYVKGGSYEGNNN